MQLCYRRLPPAGDQRNDEQDQENHKKDFRDPRRQTRDRALGNITGALVCTFIGLAFIGCGLVFRDEGFFVPGFILLGIGIALFISSAISWRLNKQLDNTQPPAIS